MVITDFLERNANEFGNEVCLVEVNPERKESRRVTWREYELIESSSSEYYRNEITWAVFDEKANRFAKNNYQQGNNGMYLQGCREDLLQLFHVALANFKGDVSGCGGRHCTV